MTKLNLLFFFLATLFLPLVAEAQMSLWMTEQAVLLRYPVPNLTHQELKQQLDQEEPQAIVLFDVREPQEYQKSHLTGAVQVNPDISAQQFTEKFGALMKGKQLVFYCSVGYRSSALLTRVQKTAKATGAKALFNLKGGIFRWYNQGHLVVNTQGPTREIDGYNERWGSVINQR